MKDTQPKITLKILAFGIAKDIVGGSSFDVEVSSGITVEGLKAHLLNTYPAFGKLNSLAIAVDNEYADDELVLEEKNEIVLIPPVSGG